MLLMRDKRQALADWVRKERAKKKWSQADLAFEMEKARGVVNKIERANNDPTLETLSVLAKAFGYPLSVVLDVLGYDVDFAKGDPWVETMSYRVSGLPPDLRRIVEGLIDSLVKGEESSNNGKAKTKPARL